MIGRVKATPLNGGKNLNLFLISHKLNFNLYVMGCVTTCIIMHGDGLICIPIYVDTSFFHQSFTSFSGLSLHYKWYPLKECVVILESGSLSKQESGTLLVEGQTGLASQALLTCFPHVVLRWGHKSV